MSETITIRCGKCGSKLSSITYVPGLQAIGCPYCGTTTTVRIDEDGSVRLSLELALESRSNVSAKKKSTRESSGRIRILFLAADPIDTPKLRVDQEIRAIDQALRQADFRDRFEIEQHWAVRVADLQSCLLRHRPHIVHFSGHGSKSCEIVLEDALGNSQPVSIRALNKLFSVLKDNIRCVVLNACYSEPQANAIAHHIDCVIGMSSTIGDLAAVNFAMAFYQALGFGRDVETAFELGCMQIDLEGLGQQAIPKLLAVNCDPGKIAFLSVG